MGLFSWISEKVSSAVSKVADYAGRALIKIAEVGEKVISKVKDIWGKVKSFVKKAVVFTEKVVIPALKVVPHPWAQAIAHFLEKGVGFVKLGSKFAEKIEESPVIKKIDAALQDIFPKIKKYGGYLTDWAEIQKSKQLQNELQDIIVVPKSKEENALLLTKMLNKYIILKSEVLRKIDNDDINSMEQYLQVMATKKIFENFQTRINNGLTIEQISHDDIFLFDVAEILISENPTLTDDDKAKFDKIIEQIFGRPLLPLVFSEMVTLWGASLDLEVKKRDKLKNDLSEMETRKSKLEKYIEFNVNTEQSEFKELEQLVAEIPAFEIEYKKVCDKINHQESYIYAAEGMQRALEENIAEVIEDPEEVRIVEENIPELSNLLISCFRQVTQWEDLTEENKSLIRDFANIFKEASKARANKLLTVEVAA